jgi:hypothetical protein
VRAKTAARRAISILLVVLLAGCAEKDEATADTYPRAALRGAVARTLEAKSFHVDGTIVIAGIEETAEIDYVAPDRLQFVAHGQYGSTIRIVVATDSYVSNTGRADRFMVSEIPEFSLAELVPPLGVLRTADDVSLVGESYRFPLSDSIGQVVGEGEARIEDGVLALVVFHFGKTQQRFNFSDYGADFSIEPPPADQVGAAETSAIDAS